MTPEYALGQVIEDTGKKTINYIYDFGDNWEHRIKIGRITDPVPGELYPRLTEVTGKCPPEDVGGFPGYYGFLDAMADPKHPEHDHLIACITGKGGLRLLSDPCNNALSRVSALVAGYSPMIDAPALTCSTTKSS